MLIVSEKIIYFKNADRDDSIIRERPGMFELEVISPRHSGWTKTLPNSSYEKDHYLGEGNCCMFPISYKEAKEKLVKYGVKI